jgi:phage anti-repressor protein
MGEVFGIREDHNGLSVRALRPPAYCGQILKTGAIMAETQVTPSQQLIPVFLSNIGGVPAHVCDGRALHAHLENGDKFADWIKGRIEKYSFQENQDFALVSEKTEIKKGRGGDRRSTDYHLCLDMAKELSMVENNDKGREARRYFIAMEKKALEAAGQVVLQSHLEMLLPSEQQTLSEIVHAKAAPFGENVGKVLAEIWSRLHRKFRVAKYSQLPRTQLSDAILYITSMEIRGATLQVEKRINLTRVPEIQKFAQGMEHYFWFGGSASHAVWSRMRKIGDGKSTDFPESKLPEAFAEIARINERAEQFLREKYKFEQRAIKWVFGEDAEIIESPDLMALNNPQLLAA